jgi:STE24 endopeptidase
MIPSSLALQIAISLIFAGITLVCLPPLIIRVWRCKPLEDTALKVRLEDLCTKAHFKHAGIKTWTVMNNSLTAAIIGILPRMRYVMFTKRLLRELSPEEIEAILAHEIGHSYRRHLLLFPLIIFGALVILWILSGIFSEPFNAWFLLQSQLHPSSLWELAYYLSIYLCCAIVVALYFRYVFGLFSRLFERQADLHGFELHLDPQHMINALNYVAIATGHTHDHPNWHHYSIRERIDFLKAAQQHPQVIATHHRRTRRYFIGYLILLFAGILLALHYNY